MSELIEKTENRNFRWKLLTEVSALALIAYAATLPAAKAENSDQPTVWIELGGQLSRLENSQEKYAPPFVVLTPSNLSPPQMAETPPRHGMEESASLTFQPTGSEWAFSASIRYGRASNDKHVHQQSDPSPFTNYLKFHRSRYGVYHHFTNYSQIQPIAARFADAVVKQSESHAILDFRAGKDLGIGLFGRDGLSNLNVGVRFAQFTSKSRINLREDPDWQFKTHITTFSSSYGVGESHYTFHQAYQSVAQPFHSFVGAFRANRSFTGVGPTISWNSSESLAGNSEVGHLALDWGVNAALLFGRQKTNIHHQTTSIYHLGDISGEVVAYQGPATPDHTRSRGVVVPNVGGFAGFSVKYPNAKVSFGYKADFFFGAMDGGIDVRRTEDVGFHGPYAVVSIGLGG